MLILAHTAGIQRSADRPEQHECSTTSAARVLHDDIDGTHAHLRSDYVRVLYSNLSYSNPYLSAAAAPPVRVRIVAICHLINKFAVNLPLTTLYNRYNR